MRCRIGRTSGGVIPRRPLVQYRPRVGPVLSAANLGPRGGALEAAGLDETQERHARCLRRSSASRAKQAPWRANRTPVWGETSERQLPHLPDARIDFCERAWIDAASSVRSSSVAGVSGMWSGDARSSRIAAVGLLWHRRFARERWRKRGARELVCGRGVTIAGWFRVSDLGRSVQAGPTRGSRPVGAVRRGRRRSRLETQRAPLRGARRPRRQLRSGSVRARERSRRAWRSTGSSGSP